MHFTALTTSLSRFKTVDLPDCEHQYAGTYVATLNEQALKGEGEMAEALYRNVYGMEDGKRKQAEALARYVQRELACLAMTDTEAVMSGRLKFSTDFLGSE